MPHRTDLGVAPVHPMSADMVTWSATLRSLYLFYHLLGLIIILNLIVIVLVNQY